MSLQQLKKEFDSLKQKITLQNSQAECLFSNAWEDLTREINHIGERMRERGEVYVLSEIEKEELFSGILTRSEEMVKDPYFQRLVRGV